MALKLAEKLLLRQSSGGGSGAWTVPNAGIVAVGTTSLAPAWQSGKQTASGDILWGLIFSYHSSSTGSQPISVTGTGWALSESYSGDNKLWVTIWQRNNCGANESPPTFSDSTAAYIGGLILEGSYSGHTAASVDKLGTVESNSNPVTVTASAADSAIGRLVLTLFGSSNQQNNSQTLSMTNITTPIYSYAPSGDYPAISVGYGVTNSNSSANSAAQENGDINYWEGIIASYAPA